MLKSTQIVLTLVVALISLNVTQSTAQAGLVYSFIADQDVPGNSIWTDNQSASPVRDWTFVGGSRSPVAVDSSTGTTFSTAYDFGGKADSTGFQGSDLSGSADAAFEIWFKPDDFTGQEVLFETGGINNGVSLVLDGSVLRFATTHLDVPIRPETDLAALGFGNFIHAVGVIDITNDATLLYVNGELEDSLTGVNNWSVGSPGAGLGGINNSLGGFFPGPGSFGDYDGQIALLNLYDAPLSAGQVLVTFQDNAFVPVPEPSSVVLLVLGALGLMRHTRRRRRSA